MANQSSGAGSTPQDSERKRTGETLRTIRELRGVTPLEMAGALGISRQYVYNIESGRKPLTYVLLAKAADYLKVSQLSIMKADSNQGEGAA